MGEKTGQYRIMNSTDIAALEGRELDAAVALAVGWRYWKSKHGHWVVEAPDGKAHEPMYGAAKFDSATGQPIIRDWWNGVDEIPDYSTDLNAAWLLVEHMREHAPDRHAWENDIGAVLAWAHRYTATQVAAAICRAVLSAQRTG